MRLRLVLLAGYGYRFQSTHPHGVRPFLISINSSLLRVSIHAPTRGATNNLSLLGRTSPCFNPRTHTGCDYLQYDQRERDVPFQSTHPHGVRLIDLIPHNLQRFRFNPRTHTGCDIPWMMAAESVRGFNPRTHTGCDLGRESPRASLQHVSIHAPTRGATLYHKELLLSFGFQSTHPHGVRPIVMTILSTQICFNPRTHTGCDLWLQGGLLLLVQVSIHAPTRGATNTEQIYNQIHSLFQSTHPHGVRPVFLYVQQHITSFNPRTHTGCDKSISDISWQFGVSIHAPTRGATTRGDLIDYVKRFQSTHPHGVRRAGRRYYLIWRNVSIHAPTRGATGSYPPNHGFLAVFQSTHPHGVRPVWASVSSYVRGFNPRTHTGCDCRTNQSWHRCRTFQSTHPHGVRPP